MLNRGLLMDMAWGREGRTTGRPRPRQDPILKHDMTAVAFLVRIVS